MEVETLKDVLYWTREFHRHLSECLTRGTDRNNDQRARMMLAYLADHEKVLAQVISGFERSGNEHALNTWCYEYVQKHPIVQGMHCEAPFSELDAQQIMEVVTDQHAQVIALYRHLVSKEILPAAREILESLKSVEEHEMMRMAQAANRFSDM